MPTLSVFMIVLNEEDNLERSLASVLWADEIIVVDGGSTDCTREIAARFTKKITIRQLDDFSGQKNYAMSLATGDWLLSLDADEEVTDELKKEIQRAISGDPGKKFYRFPRRSHIFGRVLKFSGTQDDQPVRLFRKGTGTFKQTVHESLDFSGKAVAFSAFLNHYTYPSLKSYMARFNRYTSLEAQLLIDRGRPMTSNELTRKPPLQFLKLYGLKQGFRDGIQGLIFCVLSAYYVFIKHAKQRELET